MVVPQHHAHISVPRHLCQFVCLQQIGQTRRCFVSQVMEMQPGQTGTLAGAIKSLRHRVWLESKHLAIHASRQAAKCGNCPCRQRHGARGAVLCVREMGGAGPQIHMLPAQVAQLASAHGGLYSEPDEDAQLRRSCGSANGIDLVIGGTPVPRIGHARLGHGFDRIDQGVHAPFAARQIEYARQHGQSSDDGRRRVAILPPGIPDRSHVRAANSRHGSPRKRQGAQRKYMRAFAGGISFARDPFLDIAVEALGESRTLSLNAVAPDATLDLAFLLPCPRLGVCLRAKRPRNGWCIAAAYLRLPPSRFALREGCHRASSVPVLSRSAYDFSVNAAIARIMKVLI